MLYLHVTAYGAAFRAVKVSHIPFSGVACEKASHLRAFVRDQWQQVASHSDLCRLDSAFISRQFLTSSAKIILFVAGPNCQPFSGLSSNPGGFDDARANLIDECVRVGGICAAMAKKHKVPFVWILEEVASMSAHSWQIAISKLGGEPTLVHSADFGIVHRARSYWS